MGASKSFANIYLDALLWLTPTNPFSGPRSPPSISYSEQPIATHVFPARFRARSGEGARASAPRLACKQPFKAVIEGDETVAKSGERGLVELIATTHAGMTTDEFLTIVTRWLSTARDQRFKRPYTELIYQPMLELLAYLRANGFKTFIVSRSFRVAIAASKSLGSKGACAIEEPSVAKAWKSQKRSVRSGSASV